MIPGWTSCGAEKLAFTREDSQKIVDVIGYEFEMMCGCPKELFLALGEVIFKGKMYLSGEISTVEFRTSLAKSERLRDWQAKRDIFPTNGPHWRLLANAFSPCLNPPSVEVSRYIRAACGFT